MMARHRREPTAVGTESDRGLIAFVCVRSAHHNGKAPPDHLTIHDGQWAYCPQDSRADEHEWQPTGGARLSDMRAVVRRL